MAEALGVAASVISVASFAIQLADSVKKACEFWESVEDGPEELHRICQELRLLSSILRFISHEQASSTADAAQDSLILGALKIAKEDISELDVLVTELASKTDQGHGRLKRKWGQIQIAMKAGKITKMGTHIECAKSTLIMLQASRAQTGIYHLHSKMDLLSANFSMTTQPHPRVEHRHIRVTDTNDVGNEASQEEDTKSCIRSVASASGTTLLTSSSGLLSRTKTKWTSINAGLARLTLQSSSTRFADTEDGQNDDDTPLPTKTTYVVSFLLGISSCRRGFRFSTTGTFNSMQLDTIRRRPNDSPIFTLCLNGDTRAVQKLLELGQASLFDANESGRGLLHIACRNGHSKLAKLLLLKGVDYYMRSDTGDTAIDELNEYDIRHDREESYERLATITDTLVRETAFDPFNYSQKSNYRTLSLYNGLPYEILKYLLSQDSHLVSAKNMFRLIFENLLLISDVTDDFEICLDMMFTKYEKMTANPATRDEWPFSETFLQILISQWIFAQILRIRVPEAAFKISRCLMLTEDLWEPANGGTPLDTIAQLDPEWVQPWLELLAENGIDIGEYLQYESDKHPDGLVNQGEYQCCRLISLDFQKDENGVLDGVQVENVCDQQHAHFHTEYRCEAWNRRDRCITQLHDVLVDDAGKPLQNFPGGWSETLIPNSECFLAIFSHRIGKEHGNALEDGVLCLE